MSAQARRSTLALGALAAALLASLPAAATTSEALDMRELVRRADETVVATAVDSRVHRDGHRRIVTDVTLRVERALQGTARVGGRIVVRRLGGAIGDLGMRIEGEPSFEIGGRYLLFLRRLPGTGVLRPVGMSQGVMRVRRGGTAGEVVEPGAQGLRLMRRTGGALVPAPAALPEARPLDRVIAEVTDLVAADRGTLAR